MKIIHIINNLNMGGGQNLLIGLAEMQQKGREELAKTSITQSFEGEVEARIQFIYKRDFNIGDLVQVQNEYGQSGKARVSEIVFSEDTSGESMTPTFTAEV